DPWCFPERSAGNAVALRKIIIKSAVTPKPSGRPMLKEATEERTRFIRDADNLVRCLTIEFEIELGLGSTVVPVGKKFELAPPQPPLRQCGASGSDAHPRRLPGDPAFPCDRFGRGDDPARDETW